MEMTAQPAAQILLQQMGKAALGFTHLPLRLLYSPGVPLLLAGTGALFLVGVAMSVWSFDLRSLLLLLSLVSVVVLSGLSRDAPASQRYIIAVPSVGILVALPLTRLTHWLQELWPEHRRFVAAGLIVVMAWLMWTDLRYYFFDAFENYTLGGENTRAATDIATYLQDQEEPAQDVYFFGFPRMGYHSLSTIPYLNPGMNPIDVEEPLQKAPEWQLTGPTIFIFLPERAGELDHVRSTYPSGQYKVFHKADGQSLFMTYEVGQR